MENNIYTNMESNVIDQAANFIAEHEGLQLHVYKCPVGVSTIGYGHVLRDFEDFQTITESQALELLKLDTSCALVGILRNTKVQLNINQQIALTSFVYNLGLKAYIASSLRQKLNRSEYVSAANEFMKWIYAGGRVLRGLINRRKKEMELFLCN